MKTKIKKIEVSEKNGEKFYLIRFDYFNKEAFTYLSKRTLKYFREARGVKKFRVGQRINVFKVKDSNNYKLVEVYD